MWPCPVPLPVQRGFAEDTSTQRVSPISEIAPVLWGGGGGRGLLPVSGPISRCSALLDAKCGGSVLPAPLRMGGVLKPSSRLTVPGRAGGSFGDYRTSS